MNDKNECEITDRMLKQLLKFSIIDPPEGFYIKNHLGAFEIYYNKDGQIREISFINKLDNQLNYDISQIRISSTLFNGFTYLRYNLYNFQSQSILFLVLKGMNDEFIIIGNNGEDELSYLNMGKVFSKNDIINLNQILEKFCNDNKALFIFAE